MIPNGFGCSARRAAPGPWSPATPNFLHSLERGLIVMRLFTPQQPKLTLGGAAAATGMSRATARRFLLTLAGLSCVRPACCGSSGLARDAAPQRGRRAGFQF